MILYRVLGAISLGITATACFAQDTHAMNDFTGKWMVTNVVGYSYISAGIPEAKRLLGKILNISKNQIEFDGEVCKPHDGFSVSTIDTAAKFNEYYGVNMNDAGLPNRTLLLDSSNCIPVFKLDEHRVVFGSDGVILRATNFNPKHAP